MATDEELTQTASDLAASLRDFQGTVGQQTALENRTTISEKDILRGKRWVRLTIFGLILDVILSLGLGVVALNAKSTSETTRTLERELCIATQNSWNTRASLSQILTKPAVLSPEVEKLFPSAQIESLRLQIAASNRNKTIQREQLAKSNGPRPRC